MNNKIFLVLLVAFGLGAGYISYQKKNKTETTPAPVAATDTAAMQTPETVVPSHTTPETIIAKANGIEYSKGQLTEKIKLLFGGILPDGKTDIDQLDPNIKSEIIKNTILVDIVYDHAQKAGIANTEAYKKELAARARDIETKMFLDQEVKKNITPELVKKEFNQIVQDAANNEEIKAKHILVENEADAKMVEEELAKGVDFEELVKKYSKDSSKDNKGDLGYFTKGQMVKPFEDAAFALKIGQVSAPIKSDFGWHVIKLIDRRKVKLPTFEEEKPMIERNLTQKFIQSYLNQLLVDS
jgi:peptidyl-prolyl cis-trans isomerase C